MAIKLLNIITTWNNIISNNLNKFHRYPYWVLSVYYCAMFYFIGDVFERERPSHVCHLAARAGVRASIIDPYIYVHSNIEGDWSPVSHQFFSPSLLLLIFFYFFLFNITLYPWLSPLHPSLCVRLFLSSFLLFLLSFFLSFFFLLFSRHHSSAGFSSSLWLCKFRICIFFQCVR